MCSVKRCKEGCSWRHSFVGFVFCFLFQFPFYFGAGCTWERISESDGRTGMDF